MSFSARMRSTSPRWPRFGRSRRNGGTSGRTRPGRRRSASPAQARRARPMTATRSRRADRPQRRAVAQRGDHRGQRHHWPIRSQAGSPRPDHRRRSLRRTRVGAAPAAVRSYGATAPDTPRRAAARRNAPCRPCARTIAAAAVRRHGFHQFSRRTASRTPASSSARSSGQVALISAATHQQAHGVRHSVAPTARVADVTMRAGSGDSALRLPHQTPCGGSTHATQHRLTRPTQHAVTNQRETARARPTFSRRFVRAREAPRSLAHFTFLPIQFGHHLGPPVLGKRRKFPAARRTGGRLSSRRAWRAPIRNVPVFTRRMEPSSRIPRRHNSRSGTANHTSTAAESLVAY